MNRQESTRIYKNRQKLPRIAKDCQDSSRIKEIAKKIAKIAKNRQELSDNAMKMYQNVKTRGLGLNVFQSCSCWFINKALKSKYIAFL